MKRVNVSFKFFLVLGAMEGVLFGILAAFFINTMLMSNACYYALSYTDWLVILVPIFALIGALFNLASAIFLYDDETVKPKKRFRLKR